MRTRTNGAYDYAVPASATTSYASNGLNQYTNVCAAPPCHDARGNLTDDGSRTYGYDARNRLVSASGGVSLGYDPAGRLHQIAQGGTTTRFVYDGADVIAEVDGAGNVLRRHVHGPGQDEPLVRYDSDSVSNRRWLYADERGSIVAAADWVGNVSVNKYDAYGEPAAGNTGRFQYTGQTWLAEAGLYHYKARAYHPGLGRFMQTDPIGLAGGMNLYGYAGGDPVNLSDPFGLYARDCPDRRRDNSCNGSTLGGPGGADPADAPEVITAWGHRLDLRRGWITADLGDLFSSWSSGGALQYAQYDAAAQENNAGEQRAGDACQDPSMDALLDAADAAYDMFPRGRKYNTWWARGNLVHGEFARRVRMLGPPYASEVSYRDRIIVTHGTWLSIRADAVYGEDLAEPLYAVEMKTGFGRLGWSQEANYRDHLPEGTALCLIVETPAKQ